MNKLAPGTQPKQVVCYISGRFSLNLIDFSYRFKLTINYSCCGGKTTLSSDGILQPHTREDTESGVVCHTPRRLMEPPVHYCDYYDNNREND